MIKSKWKTGMTGTTSNGEPEPEPSSQDDDEAAGGSLTSARTAPAARSQTPAPEPAVEVAQPREETIRLPLGSSSAYRTRDHATVFARTDNRGKFRNSVVLCVSVDVQWR